MLSEQQIEFQLLMIADELDDLGDSRAAKIRKLVAKIEETHQTHKGYMARYKPSRNGGQFPGIRFACRSGTRSPSIWWTRQPASSVANRYAEGEVVPVDIIVPKHRDQIRQPLFDDGGVPF